MSRILTMFAISFLIITELLQVISAAAAIPPAQCYQRSRDYYPYFSTRTAYENVHGHVTRVESSCKPVQIWMLTRHGTRYPGKEIISGMLNMPKFRDEILQNHEQGSGSLCANDLEKLREWQLDPNVKLENAEVLSEQGEKDLHDLAARMKETFSDLLDGRNAKPEDFIFRSTDTQRTKASMNAFSHSLFDKDERLVQPRIANDTLLTADQNCPIFKSHTNAERSKFDAGPEIQTVMTNVGRRLGFSKIDYKQLRTIYELCRFETAWYPSRLSTWCTVFREDELKVLEYREDLGFYHFTGPARPVSAKVGCQMLGDMFKHFKALASGNYTNQPKGIFYFAHTVTLQNLMASLKLFDDSKPLSATNYAEVQDRTFRTSLLGPFATNVAAVFYRCDGAKVPNKVTIYRAEKLVKLPGCQDGLCDWDVLEKKYASDVDTCSMDFCTKDVATKNNKNSATSVRSKLIVPMLLSSVHRFFSKSN